MQLAVVTSDASQISLTDGQCRGSHKSAEQMRVIATKGSASTIFPCCIFLEPNQSSIPQASLVTCSAPRGEL